jgi:hypothetical protein
MQVSPTLSSTESANLGGDVMNSSTLRLWVVGLALLLLGGVSTGCIGLNMMLTPTAKGNLIQDSTPSVVGTSETKYVNARAVMVTNANGLFLKVDTQDHCYQRLQYDDVQVYKTRKYSYSRYRRRTRRAFWGSPIVWLSSVATDAAIISIPFLMTMAPTETDPITGETEPVGESKPLNTTALLIAGGVVVGSAIIGGLVYGLKVKDKVRPRYSRGNAPCSEWHPAAQRDLTGVTAKMGIKPKASVRPVAKAHTRKRYRRYRRSRRPVAKKPTPPKDTRKPVGLNASSEAGLWQLDPGVLGRIAFSNNTRPIPLNFTGSLLGQPLEVSEKEVTVGQPRRRSSYNRRRYSRKKIAAKSKWIRTVSVSSKSRVLAHETSLDLPTINRYRTAWQCAAMTYWRKNGGNTPILNGLGARGFASVGKLANLSACPGNVKALKGEVCSVWTPRVAKVISTNRTVGGLRPSRAPALAEKVARLCGDRTSRAFVASAKMLLRSSHADTMGLVLDFSSYLPADLKAKLKSKLGSLVKDRFSRLIKDEASGKAFAMANRYQHLFPGWSKKAKKRIKALGKKIEARARAEERREKARERAEERKEAAREKRDAARERARKRRAGKSCYKNCRRMGGWSPGLCRHSRVRQTRWGRRTCRKWSYTKKACRSQCY